MINYKLGVFKPGKNIPVDKLSHRYSLFYVTMAVLYLIWLIKSDKM